MPSLARSTQKSLKLPSLTRSVQKPLNQLGLRSAAKLMKPASQLVTSQRVGGRQRPGWHQPSWYPHSFRTEALETYPPPSLESGGSKAMGVVIEVLIIHDRDLRSVFISVGISGYGLGYLLFTICNLRSAFILVRVVG